ncbi:DUF2145 domain-containing protein [Undibacterium fentianense]|uniref:DUF2145 domain-containing protein n=1 Tax=Undibacterium fentianense TaxID=2828728 RepID=A0A941E6E1_9BURK|nr:DUF2145 domain-containing protein [Undibacterium fentianense]MBR7799568.1 DUF2145 domain-containing protein [Undibacterium fentianense]
MLRSLSLFFLVITCSLEYSYAGQTCESKPPDPVKLAQSFELAQKVKTQLDLSGAQLALLARVGQDLSRYQLTYSHLGLVQKDEQGRWIVTHELNRCGTAESDLFHEGLANFFMDDPFRYEALILIPRPAFQQRLSSTLSSAIVRTLHEAHYNMLAYPFSVRYQNSNQWALELLASAFANDLSITSREQAQNWLQTAGYRPSTIEIPTLTRLSARMFRANIAFDDHPLQRRISGRIDTVTVDSIEHFLTRRDALLERFVITYP